MLSLESNVREALMTDVSVILFPGQGGAVARE